MVALLEAFLCTWTKRWHKNSLKLSKNFNKKKTDLAETYVEFLQNKELIGSVYQRPKISTNNFDVQKGLIH